MANDMNMVALIGRLTRDAEVTFTSGGMAIAKFSLAVNKRKKVGDSWEDEAHFFGCTLFGKSAEAIEEWLKKGKQVAITGELRQSRWEQDGQNRSKIEIVANSVQLLASPGDNKMDPSAPPTRVTAPPQRTQAPRQQSYSTSAPASPQYGHRAPQKPKNDPYGRGEMLGPESFNDDQIPF